MTQPRKKMKIMSVVGARPNFMKIAPFVHEIERSNTESGSTAIDHCLVHTGQHYDPEMYESFFRVLNIPTPDVDLGVGSGSHAEQVGRTMIEFEKVLLDWEPDWVVVVGDVNATCACSITAKKHHVPVAHIEAGLRSGDELMPEEINRMVTDAISDILFTPDAFANSNLEREGHSSAKISFVGNIMIDTLNTQKQTAAALDLSDIVAANLACDNLEGNAPELRSKEFATMTLHRPSNVDHPATLASLVDCFENVVARALPLVWSLHPRTRRNLQEFGIWERVVANANIILVNPVDYLSMLKLNMESRIILTDSGGLQEECCVVGTPCITMRENTERPVTLIENGGASILTGPDTDKISNAFQDLLARKIKPHAPPLWDGKTALRIVEKFQALDKSI